MSFQLFCARLLQKGNLFGSPRAEGQVTYADPDNQLSYGFVSRYMSPLGMQVDDPRFKMLQKSVLRVVDKCHRN